MARSTNPPRRVRARDRDARTLELRARGLTFREIGQQLGISHVTAQKALDRALAKLEKRIAEQAPALRAEEATKLETAAAALMPRVLDGDARAQDTWLRNRQRYASLLGLDLKPPDVTVDQSQNVIVLPAWGEQLAQVEGEAHEIPLAEPHHVPALSAEANDTPDSDSGLADNHTDD